MHILHQLVGLNEAQFLRCLGGGGAIGLPSVDFFLSDSLIVALFLKRSLWIQRARDKGHDNLGIYDMGDEKLVHPTDYTQRLAS